MLYATLPAPRLLEFRRDLNQMFDEVFTGTAPSRPAWTPATDIREDDAALTFEMELAGVRPDEVEITTDNGVLTIKGEKGAANAASGEDGAGTKWRSMERVRGPFLRRFQLPPTTDGNAAEASFAHGVLRVRVPKLPAAQPKRIQITTK